MSETLILTSVTDEQSYQRILNSIDATEWGSSPVITVKKIMFVEKSKMRAGIIL